MVFVSFAIASISACSGTMRRGDQAFEAGRYETALYEYQARMVEDSQDARAHFRAGYCLRFMDRLDEARREFAIASQYGYGPEADVEWGRVEMDLANYDGALTAFKKAAARRPSDPAIMNAVAVASSRVGRGVEAEQALKDAVSRAPGEATAYLNLGVVYDRNLNMPDRAYAHYACYARLAPDEAQDRRVLWRMSVLREGGSVAAGVSEKDAGCPELATPPAGWLAAEVVPLTRIKPTGDARLAQVERLYRNGKFAQAAEVGAAVQAEGGLTAPGFLLIGLSFLHAGEPSKAIPRLKESVNLDPSAADAWYELGWAYEIAGDKDTATETWTEAKVKFPGDPRFALVMEGR
jgi:tetratricopeptide (TPR) repeat protein